MQGNKSNFFFFLIFYIGKKDNPYAVVGTRYSGNIYL